MTQWAIHKSPQLRAPGHKQSTLLRRRLCNVSQRKQWQQLVRFSALQWRTGMNWVWGGASGDLPIPAQQNANMKQIQHASKRQKNSRISCSLKILCVGGFIRGRNMKINRIYYVILKMLSYAWAHHSLSALVKPFPDNQELKDKSLKKIPKM